MNKPEQKNPPAIMIGESLSKVLADAGSNGKADLDWRYAVYRETIRVEKRKGMVAAGAYYNCGVIDLSFKRYEQACANFKAAIRLDPHDLAAKHNLLFAKNKLKLPGVDGSLAISPVSELRNEIEIYMRINANAEGRSLDASKPMR